MIYPYPTYIVPPPNAGAIVWPQPVTMPAPMCAGASLTGYVPTNTTGCAPLFFPNVITLR